ncbi:MAG TPA: PA14 domain-containing protein [Polyangia bacterium]|nr:PA14 domain-containing protein [Polyangia bacterium]
MRRGPRRLRDAYALLASAAVHAALVGLVSLRACGVPPDVAAPGGRLVAVELAAVPPPPGPRTARPGGGVPDPPVRRPRARRAESATSPAPALVPQEPRGREAAVVATTDAVAGPSRPLPAPAVTGAPPGSGPGAYGGPGGPGAGRGGGGPPLVSRRFAFGGDGRARFTGVACFITPGTLRIADVRGCVPVATFYTNTFDISERQQAEGFPGISTRSTWFMIEYTGVFTVRAAGTYEFRLHSDDGSYLFIDGERIIDNDGKHKPESRRGSTRLAAGEHHLRLVYAQTTDRMALQLYVRVPGGDETLFTPSL